MNSDKNTPTDCQDPRKTIGEGRYRMSSLQKAGGVAALIMAATFIVGFAVFVGVLAPVGYFEADPVDKVATLVENQLIVSLSYLTSFVVWGIFMVVLALALHDLLKSHVPTLSQIAAVFGFIWAGIVIASGMVANVGIATVAELFREDPTQAGLIWKAVETVQLGLGGGNEIIGGLWVLLISWAVLKAKVFTKALNYLGVVIGAAGLFTVIPIFKALGAVEALGIVFGLGLIVWFVWVGIVMLRSREFPAKEKF